MSTSSDLRDALTGFAQLLQPLSYTDPQVAQARTSLINAAGVINAQDVDAKLAGSPAFAHLKTLTAEINTKADQIANQEKNTARIIGIASGVATLAGDIAKAAIDPATILTDVTNIQSILD